MARARAARGGFTLVEVLVALIILTVGVLGLAGTTALAVRQVALADVTSERSAALQSTIERLRSMPYDSIDVGTDTDSIGRFQVSWTVAQTQRTKSVRIVTIGPGLSGGTGLPGLRGNVADTFVYRIVRP